MDNIELYIDGKLCDTGSDFSIRLNRKIIDPSAFSFKDAQYSYSVSLPATTNNSCIFGYANIVEAGNKFIRDYTAELIVNSYRIFNGRFRLSEINETSFKGNLFLPAPKEIKELFGEEMMNENAPLYLANFADTAAAMNRINRNAATSPQDCIFPMALYGIIPKNGVSDDRDRHVWDSRSYWNHDDIPPSINVLRILNHIFNSKGYQLQGTAMNDVRLSSLYMSYHNPPEYPQPWNWSDIDRVSISGKWANYKGNQITGYEYEKNIGVTEDNYGKYSSTDIFDSKNLEITQISDPGSHIYYPSGNRRRISIPRSGYYKIQLEAGIQLANPYAANSGGIQIGF